MKKLFSILIAMLTLTACSESVDTNKVSAIEQFIDDKNYESAQDICDDIADNANLKEISINDLCRLSLAYAKLAEKSKEDANMAMATKCYREAVSINADSAAAFFAEIPVEDMQFSEMLKTLSGAIDSPCDISDRDYEDFIDDEHQHHDEGHKDDEHKKKNNNKKSKK